MNIFFYILETVSYDDFSNGSASNGSSGDNSNNTNNPNNSSGTIKDKTNIPDEERSSSSQKRKAESSWKSSDSKKQIDTSVATYNKTRSAVVNGTAEEDLELSLDDVMRHRKLINSKKNQESASKSKSILNKIMKKNKKDHYPDIPFQYDSGVDQTMENSHNHYQCFVDLITATCEAELIGLQDYFGGKVPSKSKKEVLEALERILTMIPEETAKTCPENVVFLPEVSSAQREEVKALIVLRKQYEEHLQKMDSYKANLSSLAAEYDLLLLQASGKRMLNLPASSLPTATAASSSSSSSSKKRRSSGSNQVDKLIGIHFSFCLLTMHIFVADCLFVLLFLLIVYDN